MHMQGGSSLEEEEFKIDVPGSNLFSHIFSTKSPTLFLVF